MNSHSGARTLPPSSRAKAAPAPEAIGEGGHGDNGNGNGNGNGYLEELKAQRAERQRLVDIQKRLASLNELPAEEGAEVSHWWR